MNFIYLQLFYLMTFTILKHWRNSFIKLLFKKGIICDEESKFSQMLKLIFLTFDFKVKLILLEIIVHVSLLIYNRSRI